MSCRDIGFPRLSGVPGSRARQPGQRQRLRDVGHGQFQKEFQDMPETPCRAYFVRQERQLCVPCGPAVATAATCTFSFGETSVFLGVVQFCCS